MPRKDTYNWEQIQLEYDTGLSWRDLIKKYGFSWELLYKKVAKGQIKSRNGKDAQAISIKRKPGYQKHSEETKKKISEIRIKFLKEHPDQVPYLLNHYSKGDSYPEKYFKEVFEKESIDLKFHLQVGLYELDFYNLEKKIALEIDGDQHYLDKRIVESDKRRTQFLENLGWKVVRIKWSDYQKLTNDQKREIVNQIKALLT